MRRIQQIIQRLLFYVLLLVNTTRSCNDTTNGVVNGYECTDTSICIHKLWLCDGISDCHNGEDEDTAICAANCVSQLDSCRQQDYLYAYQCEGFHNLCIYESQMCDGFQDCPRNDDEVQENCDAVSSSHSFSQSPTSSSTSTTIQPFTYPTPDYSEPTFYPSVRRRQLIPDTSDTCINFTQCIKEFPILNGKGSISIDIDAITKKMRIQLRGPANQWFGIGFGTHVMNEIYAITVSASDIDIKQRKLGNHNSGEIISNSFDSVHNIDNSSQRIVTLVRSWKIIGNDAIYDFTDFVLCNIKELKIIWAHGLDFNFGYHDQYKNNLSNLVSCMCQSISTDEPTTILTPTSKPTEHVDQTGNAYHSTLTLFIHFVGMLTLLFRIS